MAETENKNAVGLKEDCFAFKKHPVSGACKCEALDRLYCLKEKCNFYKPKEQRTKELEHYGKSVFED